MSTNSLTTTVDESTASVYVGAYMQAARDRFLHGKTGAGGGINNNNNNNQQQQNYHQAVEKSSSSPSASSYQPEHHLGCTSAVRAAMALATKCGMSDGQCDRMLASQLVPLVCESVARYNALKPAVDIAPCTFNVKQRVLLQQQQIQKQKQNSSGVSAGQRRDRLFGVENTVDGDGNTSFLSSPHFINNFKDRAKKMNRDMFQSLAAAAAASAEESSNQSSFTASSPSSPVFPDNNNNNRHNPQQQQQQQNKVISDVAAAAAAAVSSSVDAAAPFPAAQLQNVLQQQVRPAAQPQPPVRQLVQQKLPPSQPPQQQQIRSLQQQQQQLVPVAKGPPPPPPPPPQQSPARLVSTTSSLRGGIANLQQQNPQQMSNVNNNNNNINNNSNVPQPSGGGYRNEFQMASMMNNNNTNNNNNNNNNTGGGGGGGGGVMSDRPGALPPSSRRSGLSSNSAANDRRGGYKCPFPNQQQQQQQNNNINNHQQQPSNNDNNNNNNVNFGNVSSAVVNNNNNNKGGNNKKKSGGGGGGQDSDDESLVPASLLNPDGSIPEELEHCECHLLRKIANEMLTEKPQVSWDDIAGLSHAKQAVDEAIIWPMTQPDLFVGVRSPTKGLLLFGPPGTGKTLIAKAIAGAVQQCAFFSISASSLMSKWIGEGEKLVRTLFAVARFKQPSVVFIDEIDSMLTARSSDGDSKGMRGMKTEFLVQLDGCGQGKDTDQVLIIGATNRPDELDDAARRRLEKRLYIPLPELEARKRMIMHALETSKSVKYEVSDAEFTEIADFLDGYSGADLSQLVREASMISAREARKAYLARLKEEGRQWDGKLDTESVRPITIRDFKRAKMAVKPSVAPHELKRYVEWNRLFGSKEFLEKKSSGDPSDSPSAQMTQQSECAE